MAGPDAKGGDGTERDRDGRGREVGDTIGRKAERKLRARGDRDRSVWFGIGMFGMVGWSVAVPTVAGIALGIWLDGVLDDRISWTLTMLFIGVAVGCLIAWHWIRKESGHD